MSRNARLVRPFGDGQHEFFLGIAQLDELDEKTGVGPGTLIRRIASGDFRSSDLRTVIRLALVGGGMKSGEAVKLVERYVDPPVPLFESIQLSIEILEAALYVPAKRKKKEPEKPAETTTESTSTSSMETLQ